jgi:hypothetical protein
MCDIYGCKNIKYSKCADCSIWICSDHGPYHSNHEAGNSSSTSSSNNSNTKNISKVTTRVIKKRKIENEKKQREDKLFNYDSSQEI